MRVTEVREGKVTVLQLSGRLDATTCPEVDSKLSASVADNSAVVLDLAGLDYISSAGLRVILKAIKQAKTANRWLALAGPGAGVKQVLDMSGFANFCPIYADRAQAVAGVE